MTLCLTFDDGLRSQAQIAAPLICSRGWSAAFNVITGVLDGAMPSGGMIEDLCLHGHQNNFMTWDDARTLVATGHEVYPHTVTHVNVVALESAKGFSAVKEEIDSSVNAITRELGRKPAYFCFPHYNGSPNAIAYLHRLGIEAFNSNRPNFGEGGELWAEQSSTDILGHLNKWRKLGVRHMDISIHGVTHETGGWCPFADEKAFSSFLDDIACCEEEGWLRVVPYSCSHLPYGPLSAIRNVMNHTWDKASHLAARLGVHA